MNKFTYKIIVRKERLQANGKLPLCMLFIYARQNRRVSLNLSVKSQYWNETFQTIKKGDPQAERKNKLITIYKNRITEYETECIIKNKLIILDEAIERLNGKSYNEQSFFDYVKRQWPNYEASLKPNTLKSYKSQLNIIRLFKKNILFSDIDLSFLKAYETFLATKRHSNKNTISKSLKWIKTIINQAMKDGIITTTPFLHFKISSEPGIREYLSLRELAKLETLYYTETLSASMQETLKSFLFCSFTGLRLSDMKTLRYDYINEGILSVTMHKTEIPVFIPLISKAKSLISQHGKGLIFNPVSDQMLNKHLKRIMKLIQINKKITYHTARHTFATNSLNLGIPKDVIQKMLGHRDIKTTDIYTKYTVSYLKKEMKKWKNENK